MQSGMDRRTATLAPSVSEIQVLTFALNDQEYALNIANVVQVARMVAITPSPRAPEVMAGMINVRGKVIPVLNLRRQFGLTGRSYSHTDHLLIAQTGKRMVALIVDVVREVLIVSSDNLEPPSEIAAEMGDYLLAVAKLGDKMLLVLDLDKLLAFQSEPRRTDGLLEQMDMLRQRLERIVVAEPTTR